MAVFHYLHLRAFAHQTEDPDKVRQALRHAGQDALGEVQETPMQGANGNRIVMMEAQVKQAAAQRNVFRALARDDAGSAGRLLREVEQRLDEHLSFHLRLDKQEAYAGRLVLAAGDDAITVRGKVRAYPGPVDPRAQALEALQGLLSRIDRNE